MMSLMRFQPNRVLRLYSGGSGIDRLRGAAAPKDGRFPEDWIASCIEGNGRLHHSPGHGVSRVVLDGRTHVFPDLLRERGNEVLGAEHVRAFGATPAVLVKLLDSAERLPLQVHPTREQAWRLFGALYGKSEAWIILAARETDGERAYVMAGFNERFDPEVFFAEAREGVFERGLAMLHKLAVEPGDVVLIPGSLPHAIGPGITMVEVMEPSDLVIVPERDCGGATLTDAQRFAGLDAETALSLFDQTVEAEQALRRRIMPEPVALRREDGGVLTGIIARERVNGYFAAERLSLDGSFVFDDVHEKTFRIGVVTSGEVFIDGEPVAAGEGFMLPCGSESVVMKGRGEVIFILPPLPAATGREVAPPEPLAHALSV